MLPIPLLILSGLSSTRSGLGTSIMDLMYYNSIAPPRFCFILGPTVKFITNTAEAFPVTSQWGQV